MRNAQIKGRELECFIISCEANGRGLGEPSSFIAPSCLSREQTPGDRRMRTGHPGTMGNTVHSSVVTFPQPRPAPAVLSCSLSGFLLSKHECTSDLFVWGTGVTKPRDYTSWKYSCGQSALGPSPPNTSGSAGEGW